MTKPILETQELTIGYPSRRQQPNIVARGLSLSLFPGEVVCLMGPNGAGKSTLLRTLSRLQPPLAGTIRIDNRELISLSPFELAKSISIVLTERVNVGQLSGFALVALGRYPYTDWTGRLSQEDRAVIHWAIDTVGATEFAERNVNELSDGERQKVMIARALAQQPHAIILDEPTAFLDLPRRVEMMSLLRQLARNTRTAILLSTHDLELSLRTVDKIWLLVPGEPVAEGAPEDLVLSGQLEKAFQSDGIEFDRQHGAFVLKSCLNRHITLKGNGFHSLWTRKALEREGFTVNASSQETSLQVQIEKAQDEPSWKLQVQHEVTRHASIYDLIVMLQKKTRHLDNNPITDKGV